MPGGKWMPAVADARKAFAAAVFALALSGEARAYQHHGGGGLHRRT